MARAGGRAPVAQPRRVLDGCIVVPAVPCFVFFFNDTATTEIYTLSLHDALPISEERGCPCRILQPVAAGHNAGLPDRKSTRLNSSHLVISYAVFCLKKRDAYAGLLLQSPDLLSIYVRGSSSDKMIE